MPYRCFYDPKNLCHDENHELFLFLYPFIAYLLYVS
jgi:hypothetical protein